MSAPHPPATASRSSRPRGAVALGVGLTVLGLGVATVLSMGIAAIFIIPLVFVVGTTMIGVWAARRHRQRMQGRDDHDVKDPVHAGRAWPTKGVIDDRLPGRP